MHLAKLLRGGGNVLLLDEPTNDLDVDTLRALEEALLSFAGCAVVISHDRWFLDRVATHVLAFEGDSQVRWFEGNFEAYEEHRRERARRRGRPPATDHLQAARALSSALRRRARARSSSASSQPSPATPSAPRSSSTPNDAGRDREHAQPVGAGAGDVQRRVADHDRALARVAAGAGAGDRRQLVAVLGVRAEAALAGREVVADPGALELEARDPS